MIIGITGTFASGKGTIVEFLKTQGFKHYSVRGFLADELEKRGISINRDSLIEIGNELRAKNSPSYIVEQIYKNAQSNGGDAVIESLRAVGEVESLKNKKDFYLFSVDAPIEIRYKRAVQRNNETDHVSFEEFSSREKREIKNSDPSKQSLIDCMNLANFKFENKGTTRELHEKVEKVLGEIKSKIKTQCVRPNWDDYFMSMAYLVAMKSKDESTHMGAVIVGESNEIKSTGYNSFVRGLNDNVAERQEKPEKYFWFEHAERNAVYNATLIGTSLRGCKIYTNGVPCMDCARAIIQSGISEVIIDKQWDEKNPGLWSEHAKRSLQMFEEVGVKVRFWTGNLLSVKKFMRGEFI